jgi:NAD(P)-dependent dehydrogenase (short-subunit alcohol dehydrogenase family)
MARDDLSMTGRTALVTGSGRNIGRAIALEFASRGANVIINARRNATEAEQVRKEAETFGVGALVVLGDAGQASTVEEIKRRGEDAFGCVDIYVCNAARRFYKDFFETTDDDWHYYLNQQLSGAWYLAKAFAPGMRDAGWGRIIHINGPDGWSGDWTRVPHSTAKGGLRTLTKSLATGLGKYGITVNDVYPGFIETVRDPSTHPQVTPAFVADRQQRIPIGRQPTCEEVAWACVFLCSERSGAITGEAIYVSGGGVHRRPG